MYEYSSLFKFTSVLLETVVRRILARCIRGFSMSNVCSSSTNCPPAICASAADVVYRDVDVFETKTISLNHIS
jgi:hypothetical protein